MQILVPARLGYPQSGELFKLQAATATFTGDAIVLDCRQLSFVDPLGLCVLHHWFKELEARRVAVHLENLPLSVESWLARMNVFDDLENLVFDNRTNGYGRNDLQGNLIEVRSVNTLTDADSVANEIANAITHGVSDISWDPDPEGMKPSEGEIVSQELAYVFSELLNNSLDHGRTRGFPHACAKVAAQYYPRLGKLRLAIVDNGCGLYETLQAHSRMNGSTSHLKAIEVALEPKVSCNRDVGLRDSVNEGLGLTMCTAKALAAGGRIGIFSGNGRLKKIAEGRRFDEPIAYWQGTAVFLEFGRRELALLNHATIAESIPGFREVPELTFG